MGRCLNEVWNSYIQVMFFYANTIVYIFEFFFNKIKIHLANILYTHFWNYSFFLHNLKIIKVSGGLYNIKFSTIFYIFFWLSKYVLYIMYIVFNPYNI